MFHHRIKVITQNNLYWLLVSGDPSVEEDKWTWAMPAKCPSVFSFDIYTNAQASQSSSMRCWPQFTTLFADVFPLNLNAEVTLVTVPFETPASWADLWLKLLTTINLQIQFLSHLDTKSETTGSSQHFHTQCMTELNWMLIACAVQCTCVEASAFIMSLQSFIQVFPSLSDSGKYNLGLCMAACVFCVCLWCLLGFFF